jgi:hypothetical protein
MQRPDDCVPAPRSAAPLAPNPKPTRTRHRLSVLASALALPLGLAACGGGGGNEVPGLTLQVTPAKGAFGVGAKCEAFDGASGTFLVATTTDVTGSCALQTGQFRGPVVVRVCGGTGVTVFDETLATPANVALGAAECLVGAAPAIPAGNAPVMGVTPLTHIAAVAAGVDPAAANPSGGSAAAITAANTQVKNAVLGTTFTAFDILDVPVPPQAGTVIASGSTKGVQYGAFVAALAQSTADPTGAVSLIGRAAALAAEFKAGAGKFTTSVTAVETAAAKLPAVATSFYAAGFRDSIVGLNAVLRPDANGDGTPTVPPVTPTGVLGTSLRGG